MKKRTKNKIKFVAKLLLTAVGVSLVTRFYSSKKKVKEIGSENDPLEFPMLEGDITVDVARNGTVIASMSEYEASGNPLMIVNKIDKDIKRVIVDDNYSGFKVNLKAGQRATFSVTTEYTNSGAFRKGCKSHKVYYAVSALTKEEFNYLRENGKV